LRDVQAAGYPNFLGMAGLHRFFHTPADDLRTTSPEILEPVAAPSPMPSERPRNVGNARSSRT
jgi:hypothetical protein